MKFYAHQVFQISWVVFATTFLMISGCTVQSFDLLKPKTDGGEIVGANCHGGAPPFSVHQKMYDSVQQRIHITNTLIHIEYRMGIDEKLEFGNTDLIWKVGSEFIKLNVGTMSGRDILSISETQFADSGTKVKTCNVAGFFGCKEHVVFRFYANPPVWPKVPGFEVSIDPPDILINGKRFITEEIRFEWISETSIVPLNC